MTVLRAITARAASCGAVHLTNGRRITLYVRNAEEDERLLPPRYARVSGVGVFRWLDGRLACALASGDIGRRELRRLTESVQRQGNR